MDLQDQLKNLFPDHVPSEPEQKKEEKSDFWIQDEALLCKFERRRGKVNTIIEGYNGADVDFKELTRQLKNHLSVGGSYKNEQIIIQGDYRDRIMDFLKEKGFNVKRVGG